MTAANLIQLAEAETGIVTLTLNRPEQRNALSAALMEQACEAIQAIEANAARRVLIVTGAGPVFCSGLDLKEAARDLEHAQRGAQLVARLLRTVSQSRLVMIAAIHGAAMAGGAGLMSACDLAVASQDTRIGYPEVHRGLVAGLVMRFLLAQVGQRHARRLLLTGESIDAGAAEGIGLVNSVVPAGMHVDAAMQLAAQVLRGGPDAIVRTKRLLDAFTPRTLDEDLQIALAQHLAARQSDEAMEGLAAFAEKRLPKWRK